MCIIGFYVATLERRLIHRNYYWYTKGKEERLRNGSTPFGFDHLPPQTVLCVISDCSVKQFYAESALMLADSQKTLGIALN
uniref:Uncharacterized protein n=1 Tax=Setaria digitata TaxID=48799 RepID=A0A915Q429_9BILA